MLIDTLYELAADSLGYFTSSRAAGVGVSAKALSGLAHRGHIRRTSHGVYRLTRFPESEFDHFAEAVLWPQIDRTALCGESALVAYGLSDANPSAVHVLVPEDYRTHRRLPSTLRLHKARYADDEIWPWRGLRVTSPARTIEDCRRFKVRGDIVDQAIEEARVSGLL